MPSRSTRELRLALLPLLALAACAASPPDADPARARRAPAPRAGRAAQPSHAVDAPDAASPAARAARAPHDELSPRASLAECLAWAELQHPAIAAAARELDASLELEPQAAGIPNTRLNYRYYIEPVETRVGPQRQAIGVQQPLPWFGRLGKQGEVAARGAEVTRARLAAVRLAVRAEVQRAWAAAYFLARSEEVVAANVGLYRQLDSVLRRSYGLGAARHPDLIRAQVELGKLEDHQRSLEEMRRPVLARLNAALGREARAPRELPDTLEHLRPADPAGDAARWLADTNPDLLALDREADRQRAAIELARKRDRPDFVVGLEWIDTGDASNPGVDGSGQDAWIVSLGLELPTARAKHRAAEREAHARRSAALERRGALELDLRAGVEQALFGLRDAERKVDLYAGALLPKARESLEATQKAFGLGTGTFLDLVDAQRVLLEFELTYERARTDHLEQRAELERLIGRPLSAGSDGVHAERTGHGGQQVQR